MSSRKRLRSGNVTLSSAFVALAAATLAGCGEPAQEPVVYCATPDRVIIEAVECEDDDDTGIIYVGHFPRPVINDDGDTRAYRVGDRLRSGYSESLVKANNQLGRTNLGLPARGGFGGNGATLASGSGG